ncbi:MAG: TIM barrel protein [Promethearchaeota archaeon]
MPKPDVMIGLAAFPFSTFTSEDVVEQAATILRKHGLRAAELLCLANALGSRRRGAPGYPSKERAVKIGKQMEDFQLSIHGPYAISLTTKDPIMLRNSRAHLTRCLRLADAVGASHVTFHAGSRRGGHTVKDLVQQRLQKAMAKCNEENITAVPAPEVGGKIASFGSFEEVCAVAGNAGCLFCWDVAHDFARGGDVINEAGLLRRLELVEQHIDLSRWRLPVHISGILAGRRGEIRHTPLDKGSRVPWRLFLSVLREQRFLDKVVIICESKATKRDGFDFRVEEALKLKTFVDSGEIDKEYRPPRPQLTQFLSQSEDEPDTSQA